MTAQRKLKKSKGFLLVLIMIVVLLGWVGWRLSLPWRVLSEAAPPEASWSFSGDSVQASPIRWTDGALVVLARAAETEFSVVHLVRDGAVNLIRLSFARVEFGEAPERFQEIDFSRWKDLLDPSRLPITKAYFPEAELKLSIFPSALDAELTAIRNRSGAIDSTARVEGGGLKVQGFLRLGWDSLENGGSFEGSYARHSNPYFFSFFDEEPFRSLLSPFGLIQFEGSFVLDQNWKFVQGIRLITAAEPSGVFEGATHTELAFSGATVFPNVLSRENRALLEGLLPDGITLFRVEARRRNDGPILMEVSLNNGMLFKLDTDSWRDGSAARLHIIGNPLHIQGVLELTDSGAMTFFAIDPPVKTVPSFHLPGILEIGEAPQPGND